MKKNIILFLLAIAASVSFAQTQQGIIKTPGRMVDGIVTKGKGIPGVTVNIKNCGFFVSGANGYFSFTVPSNTYSLTKVVSNKYEIIDRDILNKTFSFSLEPLCILMDSPDNKLKNKLKQIESSRRTLQIQLKEKIEQLNQMKIEQQEYNKRVMEIYDAQSNNEKLILKMAELYTTIDFDQIDDFQYQLTSYIQKGEMTRADSLLKTKDIQKLYDELDLIDASINADAEDIAKRQEVHKKAVEYKTQKLKEFAELCFNNYLVCQIKHNTDSAAYWLELRATKDNNNAEFIYDLATFYDDYTFNYEKAKNYYIRLIQLLKDKNEKLFQYSYINSLLARLEMKYGNYSQAYPFFLEAVAGWCQYTAPVDYQNYKIEISDKIEPDILVDVASRINSKELEYEEQIIIHNCFNDINNWIAEISEDAMFHFGHLTDYMRPIAPNLPDWLKGCCVMFDSVYDNDGNDVTEEYYKELLKYTISIYGETSIEVANICKENWYNFGNDSFKYLQLVLETYKKTYGEWCYKTLDTKRIICFYYLNNNEYDKAINFITENFLALKDIIPFEKYASLQLIYEYLGYCYEKNHKYNAAIEMYKKYLSFADDREGYDIYHIAEINRKISTSYIALKDYQNALFHLKKAKTIFSIKSAMDYSDTIKEIEELIESLQ